MFQKLLVGSSFAYFSCLSFTTKTLVEFHNQIALLTTGRLVLKKTVFLRGRVR